MRSLYSNFFISLLSATLLVGVSDPTFAVKTKKTKTEAEKKRERGEEAPKTLQVSDVDSEEDGNDAPLKEGKIEEDDVAPLLEQLEINEANDNGGDSDNSDDDEEEVLVLKRTDPEHREGEALLPESSPKKGKSDDNFSYNVFDHLKAPLPKRLTEEDVATLLKRAENGDRVARMELVERSFWQAHINPYISPDIDHIIVNWDLDEIAEYNDFYAAFYLRYCDIDPEGTIVRNLKTRAQNGNPIAQYLLVSHKDLATILSEDLVNHYLIRSAGCGFAPSLFLMGKTFIKHYDSSDEPFALQEGLKFLTHCAEEGLLAANQELALFYARKNNTKEEIFWLERMDDTSYVPWVSLRLTSLYYKGEEGKEQAIPKAIDYFKRTLTRLADNEADKLAYIIKSIKLFDIKKDSQLLIEMGETLGVPLATKATIGGGVTDVDLLQFGVLCNLPEALFQFGRRLSLQRKHEEALKLYAKAAVQGHGKAALIAGLACHKGLVDSSNNDADAQSYFLLAVKSKDPWVVNQVARLDWHRNDYSWYPQLTKERAWHSWSTIPAFKRLLALIGDMSKVDHFPMSPPTLCSLDVKLIDSIKDEDLQEVLLASAPMIEFMQSERTKNLLVDAMHKLHKTGYKRAQLNDVRPDEIMNDWLHILQSDEQERVRVLADFISKVFNELGLTEEDPLYVETISAGLRLSKEGKEDCPFAFFKRLQAKHAEVVESSCVFDDIDGVRVSVNTNRFKTLSEAVCRAKDLDNMFPFFAEMCKHLMKRAKDPVFCQNVLGMTGMSWQDIKDGSLGSPYLPNLLKLRHPDEVVSSTRWKFIRTVEFLKTTYPGMVDCEPHFVKMLAGIQNCQTGKNDGIDGYYSELQRAHGFTIGKTTVAPTEGVQEQPVEVLAAQEFISEFCLHKYDNVLRGGETRFLCDVTDSEYVKMIPQISHQVQYVKSLFGNKPTFDPYSGLVVEELVGRSKKDIFECFSHYFTGAFLVKALVEESKKNPKCFTKVCPLIKDEERYEAYDINTDKGVTSLTPYGAVRLLHRTGFLDVVDEKL